MNYARLHLTSLSPFQIGFRIVDEVARSNQISIKSSKAKAQVGVGNIGAKQVIVIKPQTYMNHSGESVGKLARFYKVPRDKVLVVFDDLDLPNAQVKLKLKGGPGGHNGMKSIIEHFGGKNDFPRLRIGKDRAWEAAAVVDWVTGQVLIGCLFLARYWSTESSDHCGEACPAEI